MKKQRSPLMAIAMSGIAASAAQATTYSEPPDFSNSTTAPTALGPFNPAVDSITGSVKGGDTTDVMQVTATPGTPVSLTLSLYNPDSSPNMSFGIYDNPSFVGFLVGSNYMSTAATGGTFNFNVPADGNYVMQFLTEGGGFSYTLGTIPEPSTTALLTAALGVAALLRRRKGSSRNA